MRQNTERLYSGAVGVYITHGPEPQNIPESVPLFRNATSSSSMLRFQYAFGTQYMLSEPYAS
jgi:hypothetical protein